MSHLIHRNQPHSQFRKSGARRPLSFVLLTLALSLATWAGLAGSVLGYSRTAKAGVAETKVVEIKSNKLHINGQPQPQLFGGEVQYFRLRAGHGRNIPREKVLALWNKVLDAYVATGANSISFYIPWDFHEYASGKFDFDGTADDDGDGRPDFPSRDVKSWFKLIQARGIHHIMARPGPYINAEWGFLGFGAIPLWFHEKYPDSHMRNSRGMRTPLYSYNSPEFLAATKKWLTAVFKNVMAPYIGKGKPIDFLQIDNETNFMWQSMYNHDYGRRSVADYRLFLKKSYRTISALNTAHQRAWKAFGEIQPPTAPGKNLAEEQDWYRFQDKTMHVYLEKIRRHWEALGVREPQVLFTLAESYNASNDGILPNYLYRNDPGRTGMMTVNLYPKTGNGANNPLLNQPFKADHDVKAADSASDYYLGSKQEWVLGPEIQGGWWRGTDVTAESRRQTYLTTIGHGLKSLFIYYFNEGQNWQTDWVGKQSEPYYQALRKDPRFSAIPEANLPVEFWNELNEIFAKNVIAGWDLRWARNGTHTPDLYFDAAIGVNGEIRPPYQVILDIGQKIIVPYGEFLAGATELTDDVCLVKDIESNVPTSLPGVRSTTMNSDWAAGLVGYLLQAGINPKIVHWGLNDPTELADCRLVIYQDNGFAAPTLIANMKAHLKTGGGVLTFLGSSVLHSLISKAAIAKDCVAFEPVPGMTVDGLKCNAGTGFVYQVQKPLYASFNSDDYARISDVPERRQLIEEIMTRLQIIPHLRIAGGGDRMVAFGRRGENKSLLYVTVKSGREQPVQERVIWSGADPGLNYKVLRLLDESSAFLSGKQLIEQGFDANMAAHGSDAFYIEPILNR